VVESGEPAPGPILNLPVGRAGAYPDGDLILRLEREADLACLSRVEPERIVWVEAPLDLAEAAWPPGVGLDVRVAAPAAEAPRLHGLSRWRDERPIRVTIPAVAGVGRAARVALALQLPIRLLLGQPSPAAVAELLEVLETYLHDPQANASVQPFDAALEYLLHGRPVTAWAALDLDPAYVVRVPGPQETSPPEAPPGDPGFVPTWISRLIAEAAECAACPYAGWCAGLFKWPDPAYACHNVKTLLATIGKNAEALASDLGEAMNLPT